MTRVTISMMVAATAMAMVTAVHADSGAAYQLAASVQDYMDMRAVALDGLDAPVSATDFAAITDAVEARAAAIRRVRVDARQGDVFTPAVSTAVRVAIASALAANGMTAAAVVASDDAEPPPARVNERFAWNTAVATPPCVLAILPALPDVLEYRFVGVDLALVDIDANLIVDVLPHALDVGRTSSGPARR